MLVLSADTVHIAIFICFSILNDAFLIARFATTRSNPITIDTASTSIAAGTAKIVGRRPTPVISNQMAVAPKQLSISPIILIPCYILY